MIADDLKKQREISRDDIAKLLSSIGKPGVKQKEKYEAVQSLNRNNKQGHGVEDTLGSYSQY